MSSPRTSILDALPRAASSGAENRPETACRGCRRRRDGPFAYLVAYSAFTKRVTGRADRLLLACKVRPPSESATDAPDPTPSPTTIIVEIARVPYRFYVPRSNAARLDVESLKRETQHCGGFSLERCRSVVDSATWSTSDARRGVKTAAKRSIPRELLRVTCFNREACLRGIARLREAGQQPPFTDCCYNFCHGSEALVNCGLPGAVGAIGVRSEDREAGQERGDDRDGAIRKGRKQKADAQETLADETVTVESPERLCCHGNDLGDLEERFDRRQQEWLSTALRVGALLATTSSPSPTSSCKSHGWCLRVASRGRRPDSSGAATLAGLRAESENSPIEEVRFDSSDPKAASKALQNLKDASFDALFVFDLSSTLKALGASVGDPCAAGSKSWFLFSKRRDCRPWTADNGVFGLGVLVFDLRSKWNADAGATTPSTRRQMPDTASQLLELGASCRALEQHLVNASKSRTNSCVVHERGKNGGFGPSPFDAFSCTMALTYQECGMVTAHDARDVGKDAFPYRGGCIVRPEAGLYADLVIEEDFFAMYPSILLAFNMSKETYLLPPSATGSVAFDSSSAAASIPSKKRTRVEADEGDVEDGNGKCAREEKRVDDDDDDDHHHHHHHHHKRKRDDTRGLESRWFFDLGETGGFEANAVDVRPANPTTMARAIAADVKKREALLEKTARGALDDSSVEEAAARKKFVNAAYGMLGNPENPYADRRVAACVTAAGRRLLAACCESLAGRASPSFRLLATHTDSLLVRRLPRAGGAGGDDDESSGTGFEEQLRETIDELSRRFRDAICREVRSAIASTGTLPSADFCRLADALAGERAHGLRVVPKTASFLALLSGKANKQYRLLRTVAGGLVTATLEKKNAGRSKTDRPGAGTLEARGIFEDAVIEAVTLRGHLLIDAKAQRVATSSHRFPSHLCSSRLSFQVWDLERLLANLPVRAFLPDCGGWKWVVGGFEQVGRLESKEGSEALESGVATFVLEYRDDGDGANVDGAKEGVASSRSVRHCIRCSDDGLLADARPLTAKTRAEKKRALQDRRAATAEAARRFLTAFARGEFPLEWYAKGGKVCVEGRQWMPLETVARSGGRIDLDATAGLLTARILDRPHCSRCGCTFSKERPLYLAAAAGHSRPMREKVKEEMKKEEEKEKEEEREEETKETNDDGEKARPSFSKRLQQTAKRRTRASTKELDRCEESRRPQAIYLRHAECLQNDDRAIADERGRDRLQEHWLSSAIPNADFLSAALLSGCDTLSEVRESVRVLMELHELPATAGDRADDRADDLDYEEALAALQREARVDPTAVVWTSKEFERKTVACLPISDGSDLFFCLKRARADVQVSPGICDRLHAATLALKRRDRRVETTGRSAKAAGRLKGRRAAVAYCRFCGIPLHAERRRNSHRCRARSRRESFACTACCLASTRCPDCDEPFEEGPEEDGEILAPIVCAE